MDDDLNEYNKAIFDLRNDITNKDISFEEVEERTRQAYKLIPINIDLNPFGFIKFVEEKYGKKPNTLTFDIERITDHYKKH